MTIAKMRRMLSDKGECLLTYLFKKLQISLGATATSSTKEEPLSSLLLITFRESIYTR